MLTPAIVHVAGLDTNPAGDCCGMRPRLEGLAELLGARELVVIAWNDPHCGDKLRAATQGADAAYLSGHSHGAAELWKLLNGCAIKTCAVASFLDLAPPGDPTAWGGEAWPTPAICDKGLWFYQRNDGLLAGVRGVATVTTDVYDVTGWGLHHSTMCADDRVWARINDAVLWDHILRLRQRLAAPIPG